MFRLNTQDVHELLLARYRYRSDISVELIGDSEAVVNVTMREHVDMQIMVAAAGDQILVSTVLVNAEDVTDRAGFNDACMRMNPINPLSNLGLQTNDGRDVYTVFGELSSASSVDVIDEEIHVLASNTLDAVTALQSYFA